MNEVPIMTKVIDKFEQHRIARMEADKNRIVSAQKWVDTVERMGENVSSRQERLMFIDSLSKAKEQLRRAYAQADFYNENQDEIAQNRDLLNRQGKGTLGRFD